MTAVSRRTLVLGSLAAPFAAPCVARAQTWPSSTIKFVIPFPPGGSTDATARLVQAELQQRLGVTIVIENRPGASGTAGTGMVAKGLAETQQMNLVLAGPDELRKFSSEQGRIWGAVVREHGIRGQM